MRQVVALNEVVIRAVGTTRKTWQSAHPGASWAVGPRVSGRPSWPPVTKRPASSSACSPVTCLGGGASHCTQSPMDDTAVRQARVSSAPVCPADKHTGTGSPVPAHHSDGPGVPGSPNFTGLIEVPEVPGLTGGMCGTNAPRDTSEGVRVRFHMTVPHAGLPAHRTSTLLAIYAQMDPRCKRIGTLFSALARVSRLLPFCPAFTICPSLRLQFTTSLHDQFESFKTQTYLICHPICLEE